MPRRLRLIALLASLMLVALAAAESPAQRGEGAFGLPSPVAGPAIYDGAFRSCRVRFRNSPQGDGDGWYVDYARAEENLSIRLSELTKTPITSDLEGNPVHMVARLTDPELFDCPFVMMTEPGGSFFDDNEAAQLRTYLLKGGFLWADDFWGSYAWEWWTGQIAKALPPSEYPITDIPLDHPIFHTLFDTKSFPQIPNVGLWLRARQTSERGTDSAVPHARGISDSQGRLMVFMTHNTDFGDAYEREGMSPDYFYHFSVPGYAIGIDVILYTMTH